MTPSDNDRIAAAITARRNRLLTAEDLLGLLLRLLVIAAVGYLILTQVFLLCQVGGTDMFPAVKDGDLAIVFRLQQTYVKNDVIAYRVGEDRRFGRIVARAGDVVTMDDMGSLSVNGTIQSGEILYPTYALDGMEYPYRVPENSVFVLGDNRLKATDSRTLGAIPMSGVDGKVITILRRRGL